MRPTSRSMSSRSLRYCSTRSRDGVATCTKTASSTSRPRRRRPARRTRAAGRRCPWCSRAGRRRGAPCSGCRAARGSRRPASRPAPSGPAPRGRRRRSRSGRRRPARRGRRAGRPGRGGSCGPTRWRTSRTKFCGGAGALEADQVGAEQALEELAAPRQLLEQLGRRERDVQEEADPQVGAQLAQHRRHQLELVVVHPDGGVLGGDLGGLLGEAPVDRDVGVPPLAVERRLGDDVVVERPQGGVGEALVELLDLLAGQRDRDQGQAVVLERLEVARRCRPASRSRRRRWRASPARGR